MILTCPRHGSHYLALAVYRQALQYTNEVKIFNEFDAPGNHLQARDALEEIKKYQGYKIVICLDIFTKMALLTNIEQINDWNVIRLTHRDKHRLALSRWYWLMCQASPVISKCDNGIEHHGTNNENYKKVPKERFHPDVIQKLINDMNEDVYNYHIPCDLEIDHDDLAEIDAFTEWNPNDYSGTSFEKIFGEDLGLDQMFKNLSTPIVGQFKEKSC